MPRDTPRIAVYTVAADWPGPLPKTPEIPEADFICFVHGQPPTDAGDWKLVPLSGFPELDSPRLSRLPKILPHLFLPSHQLSIYIDTSVQLKHDFLSMIPEEDDPACLSFVRLDRNLGEEFKGVAARRYDSLYHVAEQLESYGKSHPGFRQFQTLWGGLIVRRHFDQDVIAFGFRWALNVMRFSRRDQLSLPIALSDFPREKLGQIEGTDEASQLHTRIRGIKKSKKYIVGNTLAAINRSWAIDRERLYLEEIRSLRKLLGLKDFFGAVRSFLKL